MQDSSPKVQESRQKIDFVVSRTGRYQLEYKNAYTNARWHIYPFVEANAWGSFNLIVQELRAFEKDWGGPVRIRPFNDGRVSQ